MSKHEKIDDPSGKLDVPEEGSIVPDDVIPHGDLPPLTYRDMPDPIPLWKMIGPSVMLAGLALGSGEFVFWPYITFKTQFVFFWACLLGVTTQYFINMEISRWTLATGESAVTGFSRINRNFAWIFLACNIIPHIIPAWAKGSAQIACWLIWPNAADTSEAATWLAIGGLVGCGVLLSAGKVVYETVEKTQMLLVTFVLILVCVLAAMLVRGDAVRAQAIGSVSFELPEIDKDITWPFLLGALAFAGAGGTLNLGQSNYIKEKGYAMGRYIGRLTSPITGQEEPIAEVGYHFPDTPENRARWRIWWRSANIEHFLSFYLTCLLCLVLLTLIAYSIFYQPDGTVVPEAGEYTHDISFIHGEANFIEDSMGNKLKVLFLLMGISLLLTTEIGILDGTSRISTDIAKILWLRNNKRWTQSRLYSLFLWGTILLGSTILLLELVGAKVGAFDLFKMTAALNGAVMFFYSMVLIYLNRKMLPAAVRMQWPRLLVMIWSVLFFGFFAVFAGYTKIVEIFAG